MSLLFPFQIFLCILVYIASFLLPSELGSLLGWRKIASTSFVASMAYSQLSNFEFGNFQKLVFQKLFLCTNNCE